MCKYSAGEGYIVFGGDAAHVNQGVAHAAQGGVDAHSGCLGYFLERHVAEKAHVQHLALALGERADYTVDVLVYLRVNKEVLYVPFGEVFAVENIHGLVVRRNGGVRFVLTVEVDDEIMGYAGYPRGEFARFGITALPDGGDGLYEGLLEDIVGYVAVFYNRANVGEHTRLMAHEQGVESFVVAFGIGSHQHVVGELVEFLHFYSS